MISNDLADVPVLPFPPADVLRKISEQDVHACFDAWLAICQKLLELPPELYHIAIASTNRQSLSTFLVSYVDGNSPPPKDSHWKHWPQAQSLIRIVFLLIHRTLAKEQSPPDKLLNWRFLGRFCGLYPRTSRTSELLQSVWTRHGDIIVPQLKAYQSQLIMTFEQWGPLDAKDTSLSYSLLPLLHACPSAGAMLATGSDLLDAAGNAYSSAAHGSQAPLLLLVYLMLLAPLQLPKPNRSLTYDHLYSLRSSAEKEPSSLKTRLLLADLVTETAFLAHVRKFISGTPDESRGTALVKSIEQFRGPKRNVVKKPHRRRRPVTDAASNSFGHGETINGVHVHRMSLISQVQELFPDLGDGFIVKLLDHYNDNTEEVTVALLEDQLPTHLHDADRSEHLQMNTTANETDHVPNLAPRSTPPPPSPRPIQRRNIHDNDDFDRLAISKSQLRFGRNTDNETFKQDASSRSHAKAAIMSALAAFDADDDERDDTYDVADVGGTVDTAAGPAGDRDATVDDMRQPNEEALFTAWKMDQSVFARDAATRRGKARQALKSETDMTDEALEGWAVMLQRDPARLRRLQAKYDMNRGRQDHLRVQSGKSGASNTVSESEEGVDASSGPETSDGGTRGGASFRGRGRGGRGRGGNVAGPTDDKGTQVSRQRKEAGKGSRANHNRRDQRARKMARGGLPG